jgi:hypothetical protein
VLDDSITVIDLAAKCPPLSISNFMKMFYKNGPGSKFAMLSDAAALQASSQIGDGTYSTMAQANTLFETAQTGTVAIPLINYMAFSNQSIVSSSGDKSAFNLKNAIMGAYSSNNGGVGVDSSCWAPCSLMAIQNQLNKLKHLFDICNVECSRTFYEAMQEISSNFDGDGGSTVINTRVSVVFTNQNPVIADVIVRFNLLVELLCAGANPLLDTPLSSLYDGIDNVPVFRGGEFVGSQPLKGAAKCGNPVSMDFQKGADSLAYFFNKSVRFVGQKNATGPSAHYWTQVTTSNCLPPCFPFDVASGDIYVLSICYDACAEVAAAVAKVKDALATDTAAKVAQKAAGDALAGGADNQDLKDAKDKADTDAAEAAAALTKAKEDRKEARDSRENDGNRQCDPMPIILPPGNKLASSGSKATTQSCANESIVVANLYIDLSCGKKSKYFPGTKSDFSGYNGIDPNDVFIAPVGAFAFTSNSNLGKISEGAVGLCVEGGLQIELAKAKLTDLPPSCIGDYYLLSTQVNLFLQHVFPCNDESIPLAQVSPIQCVTSDDQDTLNALLSSVGSQPPTATEPSPSGGWGIGGTSVGPKLADSNQRQLAFSLDELACKPFAAVITDVCALPPKPGQDLF